MGGYYHKYIASYNTGSSMQCPVTAYKGRMGGGVGEGSRGRGHM